jgi:preprotein translocase subunit YajC
MILEYFLFILGLPFGHLILSTYLFFLALNSQPIATLFLVVLFAIFYFKIYRPWQACDKNAQRLNFVSKKLAYIIYIELLGLSSFIIVYLLIDQPAQSQFLNITSSSNLRDFILLSSNGISVFIGIISIIAVYFYFFTILKKTKYFSEISELQEKYTGFFWGTFAFILFGGIVIFGFLFITTKPGASQNLNILLFALAITNLLGFYHIPVYLKKYLYNSNLSEMGGLSKGCYDYKFFEDFQTEDTDYIHWISDCILFITLMLAGLSLFINCNIILLLMAEYSFLLAHYWWGQLQLIPHKKTTIELTDIDRFRNFLKITDVFILSETSKEYIEILNKDNQKSKIMKNSIRRLINQNE